MGLLTHLLRDEVGNFQEHVVNLLDGPLQLDELVVPILKLGQLLLGTFHLKQLIQ